MLLQKLLKLILPAFLLIPLLAAECFCKEAGKSITLAVLPCYDDFATFKKFHRLTEYLKNQTGLDTVIVVPKNFESIRSSLQSGEVDLILQDPHTYAKLAGFLDRDLILSVLALDGASRQRGLIIVRKDSGIKEIEELRGKSVMFGPKLSITKWVGARELFQENGINIGRDLKSYSHGGCCDDIAFYVFLKAVDAGVVCGDFFTEHKGNKSELGIEPDRLAVIGKTRPFPTRVFAARRGIDGKILARVTQALLGLDIRKAEHREILIPTGIGGFQVSRDQNYENMGTLMDGDPP